MAKQAPPELVHLLQQAQKLEIAGRASAAAYRSAWRARDREDLRWWHFAEDTLAALRAELPTAAELAQRAVKLRGGVGKRFLPFRREASPSASDNWDAAAFAASLSSEVSDAALKTGAMALYLRAAEGTSTAAGQSVLDTLGVNKTFAWADPRKMVQAIYATRGSKVIQGLHGTHLDQLAAIVGRATDPANPMTIGQVTKEISENWDKLTAYQTQRIARTETAAVWETTNYNTLIANGCPSVDSIIATGPSVGVENEDPCDECVDFATSGPYPINELPDSPPLHPNCRCTLVPAEDFLPPQEPWTGQNSANLTDAEVPE